MRKSYLDILDPSRRTERRSIYARYALAILGNAAAVTLAAILNPSASIRLARALLQIGRHEHRRVRQAVARLEKRGMIRRQKRDDGNEYLLLTEAGKKEFLREKRRALVLFRPPKWDHVWRMVIFDIRENKKTVRDAIRRHLRGLGFYHLQKSVFATPYPCKDEIRFLQKFYGDESELCLIEAVSLGEKEKKTREFFGMR